MKQLHDLGQYINPRNYLVFRRFCSTHLLYLNSTVLQVTDTGCASRLEPLSSQAPRIQSYFSKKGLLRTVPNKVHAYDLRSFLRTRELLRWSLLAPFHISPGRSPRFAVFHSTYRPRGIQTDVGVIGADPRIEAPQLLQQSSLDRFQYGQKTWCFLGEYGGFSAEKEFS